MEPVIFSGKEANKNSPESSNGSNPNISGENGNAVVLPTPWAVRWLTWPICLTLTICAMLWVIDTHKNYGMSYGLFFAVGIVMLVILETLFPLQQRWKMTWTSLKRDLKYLLLGGFAIPATNGAFAFIAIELNGNHIGPLTDWPLWLSVPAALVVVEFFQYWQHRLSHELRGKIGTFLWRIHAAHHLPDRLYVLMHGALHPIGIFIGQGIATIVPLYYLGATPETVLLFTVITNVQGLMSHFNVDIRMGYFNYLFVGNELHRFHHSARIAEAKNYGMTLSIFDLLFGTFYYRPDQFPDRIGISYPKDYPHSNQFWQVMKLPFVKK